MPPSPQSRAFLALAFGLAPAIARAVGPEASPSPSPRPLPSTEYVEVTATRIPQDPNEVPASITVVDGDEIRAQGATDLRSALAVVGGIDIAPGGDGGPAASVPEIWGLREFDAFLLVVDGVPWGGAFNPDLPTLSILDVERIEIQRGAAPVMYGATSFVGVIHVIRRLPGSGGAVAGAAVGNHDTGGVGVSTDLPAWAGFRSRLSAEAMQQGFSDPRTEFRKGHVLWRNLRDVAGNGTVRLDLDLTAVGQDPASPSPRTGTILSPDVPIDANNNPSNSRLDPWRATLTGGYARPLGKGRFDTTLSVTRRDERILRGFLDGVSTTDPNAVGYRQTIGQTEAYLDAHWSLAAQPGLDVVAGIDYLLGRATASGGDFDYFVALDGSNPPDGDAIPSQSDVTIGDHRDFWGLYGFASWTASPRWRLDAGLRWNYTVETRDTSSLEFATGAQTAGTDRQTNSRASGSVGVTFTAWSRGPDDVRLYTAYRDTFKPAAIDFGLDADPEILEPETAESIELGVKSRVIGGRMEIRLSGFLMNMHNLVVSQDVGGLPGLVNAGNERFQGADLEIEGRIRPYLMGRIGYGLHDSRFQDYVQDFGGVPTQLEGKRVEMVPRDLASAGLQWAPPAGFHAHVEFQYVGQRWLNKRNTASAGAYTVWNAGLGYRWRKWDFRADGVNLGDSRDPVAESELADAQYYRLPARSYLVTVRRSF